MSKSVKLLSVLGLAAIVLASCSAQSAAKQRSGGSTPGSTAGTQHRAGSTTQPSERPFRVVSISPRNGAARVPGSPDITVTFSDPVEARSTMPTITPSVPGSWHVVGNRTLAFTPAAPFIPLSKVTLTVQAGQSGPLDTAGRGLPARVVDNFTITEGSTLRLQQLLSILAYSPLAWQPAGQPIASSDTAGQIAAMYSPPKGSFSWRNTGWPAQLTTEWKPGKYNVFTRGLVMSYQADHGLDVTGRLTGAVWNSMLQSVASGYRNTGGYNYAIGNKAPPQSLKIWHNGSLVLDSAANTGIPQSPTPSGTFPVYSRYRNEIMRGTNPDGSHYADPVQYVAYFFDGDAVHYFPRADYGIPQSLGCIELPLAQAAEAWPYLAYGTLVTVLN